MRLYISVILIDDLPVIFCQIGPASGDHLDLTLGLNVAYIHGEVQLACTNICPACIVVRRRCILELHYIIGNIFCLAVCVVLEGLTLDTVVGNVGSLHGVHPIDEFNDLIFILGICIDCIQLIESCIVEHGTSLTQTVLGNRQYLKGGILVTVDLTQFVGVVLTESTVIYEEEGLTAAALGCHGIRIGCCIFLIQNAGGICLVQELQNFFEIGICGTVYILAQILIPVHTGACGYRTEAGT